MMPSALALSNSPESLELELLACLTETERRISRRKLWSYYPDEGPLRRELYAKHTAFFAAGAHYRERCCLSANRVGKTEGIGGYELVCHLIGIYPSWWTGRRYTTRPIKAWAAGDTGKTVRDILQAKLLGPPGDIYSQGTGLIPGDLILDTSPKAGVPDAIETIRIRHSSGGISVLQLKSFDQGRDSFQGTEQDVILLDEEPPLSVWTECLIRTMTTGGLMIATFTPLEGLSETVLHLLPGGEIREGLSGSCFVQMITWDDAPHLTQEMKDELWRSIPPYQRDARSKGIPQLGSGAIYQVAESDVVCEPFELPAHWPRVYGMDVGWNRTACVWLAHDREAQVVYAYAEHYRGHAEPSVHTTAIRARGEWIKGVVDPAARGRSQIDGHQLIADYRDLGLDLTEADNAVESGIYQVYERLSGGRLKIFKTLQNLLSEYRLYRRDDKGRIVKQNDHALDALRYGIVSGLAIAEVNLPKFVPPMQFQTEFS